LITTLIGFALFMAAAESQAPVERTMADIRFLTTAIEAYSTDYDGMYAQPDWPHEGNVADLDKQLGGYYQGTYPKRPTPHLDPWGHPYRFVISDSRAQYAIYSLGTSGKADSAATEFLSRLRHDRISDADLTRQRASANIVVASAMLVFAPGDVLREMAKARKESQPTLFHQEAGTPEHRGGRDVELLASAIETYLATHDGLPMEYRGRLIDAAALRSLLHSPFAELPLSWIDPWKRPYRIAISPSGFRTAIFTRGEHDALSAEDEAVVKRMLSGAPIANATTFGEALMITSLVPRVAE